MSTTETEDLVKLEEWIATVPPGHWRHRTLSAVRDRLVSLQGEVERLDEQRFCLRQIVGDIRMLANAGTFKDFEGEPWLRRVRNIDLDHAQVERLSQPSPAGWQLVPIEPTREHYERYAGDRFTSFRRWSEVYHDMLAAAPSAPPQASESGDGLGEDKSKHGHEG
jgi:hypothetical protein